MPAASRRVPVPLGAEHGAHDGERRAAVEIVNGGAQVQRSVCVCVHGRCAAGGAHACRERARRDARPRCEQPVGQPTLLAAAGERRARVAARQRDDSARAYCKRASPRQRAARLCGPARRAFAVSVYDVADPTRASPGGRDGWERRQRRQQQRARRGGRRRECCAQRVCVAAPGGRLLAPPRALRRCVGGGRRR